MPEFAGVLHVLAVTPKGVKCETPTSAISFWLPRAGGVRWEREPAVGQKIKAFVPAWLAAKHRQLSQFAVSNDEGTHNMFLPRPSDSNFKPVPAFRRSTRGRLMG